MATQIEIQHRLSYARAMLERGVPCRFSSQRSLARVISFHAPRHTADVTAAEQEIQDSPTTAQPFEEMEPCNPAGVLAMLQHRLEIAIATGDDKQTCQLIKAMDTAKKWQGYNTQSVSPFA